MRWVDPATVSLMMRSPNEQLSAGLHHAPRLAAKRHKIDFQVLDDILRRDHRDGIILPGPGKRVQIMNDVDAVTFDHVHVRVRGEPLLPCAEVEFHGLPPRIP